MLGDLLHFLRLPSLTTVTFHHLLDDCSMTGTEWRLLGVPEPHTISQRCHKTTSIQELKTYESYADIITLSRLITTCRALRIFELTHTYNAMFIMRHLPVDERFYHDDIHVLDYEMLHQAFESQRSTLEKIDISEEAYCLRSGAGNWRFRRSMRTLANFPKLTSLGLPLHAFHPVDELAVLIFPLSLMELSIHTVYCGQKDALNDTLTGLLREIVARVRGGHLPKLERLTVYATKFADQGSLDNVEETYPGMFGEVNVQFVMYREEFYELDPAFDAEQARAWTLAALQGSLGGVWGT